MKIRNMVLCGMFSALLCVCAWLSFPLGDTAITLQTFGVFLSLGTLGGRRGTAAIGVYLLLGAVGLPVFSGFRGGLGTLLGTTGGYLTGFLLTGLLYWAATALWGERRTVQLTALILGLLLCYLFGSVWFRHIYLAEGGSVTWGFILVKCVLPYLLPDGAKLFLAFALAKKLRPFVY